MNKHLNMLMGSKTKGIQFRMRAHWKRGLNGDCGWDTPLVILQSICIICLVDRTWFSNMIVPFAKTLFSFFSLPWQGTNCHNTKMPNKLMTRKTKQNETFSRTMSIHSAHLLQSTAIFYHYYCLYLSHNVSNICCDVFLLLLFLCQNQNHICAVNLPYLLIEFYCSWKSKIVFCFDIIWFCHAESCSKIIAINWCK